MNDRLQSNLETRRGTFNQIIAAAVGGFLYIIIQHVWPIPPRSVFQSGGPEDGSGFLGLQFRLAHLLGNYYLRLAALVVFVCLAVRKRNQRDAWIYAFLSGWAFPELGIFHWLR
jgi:hypothetical protein